MKTIKNFDVAGKKVLVRCDMNVPLDSQGNILNDFRIRKSLPTIQYLIRSRARVILMTHLGDPDGNADPRLTLDKIKERLCTLLDAPIAKVNDCVGPAVLAESEKLADGGVLLLENLRFHAGEKKNDLEFGVELSKLGDIYINDAFSESHREYASIAGVPDHLPHGAGLLLEQEVNALSAILANPQHPMVVLVGGAKVETKAAFIENISKIADTVLIGSLIQKQIISKSLAFSYPQKIIAPEDGLDAADISEFTLKKFKEKIFGAQMIIWNGPFGKFEEVEYKKGTLELAEAIIQSGAFSVVGGGETVEFLEQEGILDKFNHVSTGGGAMLDFLSGHVLPGLKALQE